MYKIGEFSKIVNIPVRTLRYYAEYGVLVPSETDKYTGYKYYSDANVEEAKLIKLLKSLDFSLDEIIDCRDDINADVLEKKKFEIKEKINLLKLKYQKLSFMQDELEVNEKETNGKVLRREEKMMIDKIYNFNRNLIVDGKLSAGKTTNVMFPLVKKMINNSESLFILDSKEEYLNKYYNTLKSNGYNVIIINLRNMDKSEGWNPLEYPYQLYKCGDKDGAIEHIERLAKTIYYKSFNEDPFWSMTAGDLFKGLVLSLFEDGKENEINLTSINSMLDKGMNKFGAKDYLTEYFNDKNPDSKAYTFASTTVLAPMILKEEFYQLQNND